MKVALVFDHSIDKEKLRLILGSMKPDSVTIFPLTSRWDAIRAVEKITREFSAGGTSTLDSARIINAEVDVIQQNLSSWSSGLGDWIVGGRSLKEWFLLPEEGVSAWWFSLISEKSPWKTTAFFAIAQLSAVNKVFSEGGFDSCIVSLKSEEVSSGIKALCRRHYVKVLPLRKFIDNVFRTSENMPTFYHIGKTLRRILKALRCLLTCIRRSFMARTVMEGIDGRLREVDDKSVLFVSYFPYVDKEAADAGILKNRYAVPLQEKLSHMGNKVLWMWIYIANSEYCFNDAARMAKHFSDKGEPGIFVDEFLSLSVLTSSIFLWCRQILIFLKLQKKIPDEILTRGLPIPEASIAIRDLAEESFIGWTALESILYFKLFEKAFKTMKGIQRCIYYLEMQAWEKALNAARNSAGIAMKTIGFQHTLLSKNYSQYFYHPSEIRHEGGSLTLPLPDVFLCNGDISYEFLEGCGYEGLGKAEAVRHIHLAQLLSKKSLPRKEKILLILGTIDREETASILSMFADAFSGGTDFKIWLKAHPFLPFGDILTETGFSRRIKDYEIMNRPLNELIDKARVVIVGNSSAVAEALSACCEVILPVFADHMFLNPFGDNERLCRKVYSPEQVRLAVEKAMAENRDRERTAADALRLISRYWCLDTSLRRWEEVLR